MSRNDPKKAVVRCEWIECTGTFSLTSSSRICEMTGHEIVANQHAYVLHVNPATIQRFDKPHNIFPRLDACAIEQTHKSEKKKRSVDGDEFASVSVRNAVCAIYAYSCWQRVRITEALSRYSMKMKYSGHLSTGTGDPVESSIFEPANVGLSRYWRDYIMHLLTFAF